MLIKDSKSNTDGVIANDVFVSSLLIKFCFILLNPPNQLNPRFHLLRTPVRLGRVFNPRFKKVFLSNSLWITIFLEMSQENES